MATYTTWKEWAEESKEANKKLTIAMENGLHMQGVPIRTDNETITIKEVDGETSIAFDKIMYIRKCTGEAADEFLFRTPAARHSTK